MTSPSKAGDTVDGTGLTSGPTADDANNPLTESLSLTTTDQDDAVQDLEIPEGFNYFPSDSDLLKILEVHGVSKDQNDQINSIIKSKL
jgi:hypothetical protein